MRYTNHLLISCIILASVMGCSTKRYSGEELRGYEKEVDITCEHKEIASPLIPLLKEVMKQIFLIRHDVDNLKDKLWDMGSNHRVARTNSRIDYLKKELYRLKDIREELLDAIYYIDPGFTKPKVIPYKGENKRYEEIERPIVMVSLQDKQYYEAMKSRGEKYSETTDFQKKISDIMDEYEKAQKGIGKGPTPIGTPGPVRKIPPKKEDKRKRYFSGMD